MTKPCQPRNVSDSEWLWRFVDKSGGPDACWPWMRSVNKDGYGRFKQTTAHRMAWILTNGPTGGLLVCHTCDNPRCCNLAHLWLGTDADNQHDKARKGRQAKGSVAGAAKLTEDKVKKIREAVRAGHRKKHVAAAFGITYKSLWNIMARKTWAHVE